MKPQAIQQATCPDCENSDDNYSIDTRQMAEMAIEYEASCECGESGTLTITDEGLADVNGFDHSAASWMEGDE